MFCSQVDTDLAPIPGPTDGHELSFTEFYNFFKKKPFKKIMPQLGLFPLRNGLSKVNMYRYFMPPMSH